MTKLEKITLQNEVNKLQKLEDEKTKVWHAMQDIAERYNGTRHCSLICIIKYARKINPERLDNLLEKYYNLNGQIHGIQAVASALAKLGFWS